MGLEAVELLVARASMQLQPGVQLLKRLEPCPVPTPLPVLPDVHQPCGAQHLQVPGDAWLVHADDADQVTDRPFAVAHRVEDAQPRRLRDGAERLCKRHGPKICTVIYMCQQMYETYRSPRTARSPAPTPGPREDQFFCDQWAHYRDGVSSDDADPEPETELETERHASWAELFFDLVAVAAVAALAHVLTVRLDWQALGLYTVLFLAVWLAWTTFMLYGNVAGSRTHVIRLMIGMFGLGVMAASVPGVTDTLLHEGDETRSVTAFTIAYVATRIYGAQSWRRGEVLLDFPVAQHTVGVLPWVVSLWTDPPVTVALWVLGVALDLWLVLVVSGDDMLERYTTRLAQIEEREKRGGQRAEEAGRPQKGPARGRPLLKPVPVVTDPRHLEERLGLFVIIVLGEGVVQIVDAASHPDPEAGLFAAGLVSFVLLAGIFGLSVQYGFAGVPHLKGGIVPARVGLALHCLVTGTIATIAVALAAVVEHGHEPLDSSSRWLLCGAVAVYFLIAQVVAFVVARHAAPRTLWISTGVVVPLAVALLGGSWAASVVAGLLAVVVLAHVAVEARDEKADLAAEQ